MTDAEHLKRNLNYALHEFKGFCYIQTNDLVSFLSPNQYPQPLRCMVSFLTVQIILEELKRLHKWCKVEEHNKLYEQLLAIW